MTPPTRDHLRPNSYAAALGEDLVFLDLASGGYACLPGVGPALSEDRRELRNLPAQARQSLSDAGLISPRPPASRPPWRAPAAPTATAMGPVEAPLWRDAPEACRILVDVALGYWRRPLPYILQNAHSIAPRPIAQTPRVVPAELARQFHRWAPLSPTPGKCLLRSFMLLRLLRRHGHDADWVFGVRTSPFRAHCWLQIGGLVLDDEVDRVAGYEPILVA